MHPSSQVKESSAVAAAAVHHRPRIAHASTNYNLFLVSMINSRLDVFFDCVQRAAGGLFYIY